MASNNDKHYVVTVTETSRDIKPVDKVRLKDLQGARMVKDIIPKVGDAVAFTPEAYIVVHVTNEYSRNDKEYDQLVILTTEGDRILTGSPSFMDAFKSLWAELEDAIFEGERFEFVMKRGESKGNDSGYLTCYLK